MLVINWGKFPEIYGNNLTKRHRILIEGRLQIRDYEEDGQKRRSADVVAQNVEFLDNKQITGTQGPSTSGYDMSSIGTEVFPDEGIPF